MVSEVSSPVLLIKQTEMYRHIRDILILILLISCNRFPDPSFEYTESYTFSFLNQQGQKFFAGESLSDTIKFKAVSVLNSGTDSFMVVFKFVKGGGIITDDTVYTGSDGIAKTMITLGTDAFEHVLRARVYNLSGRYITYSDFRTFGFRENAWDKISSSPDGYITSLASDTVNDVTLMISGNKLYRQGARYFDWIEIQNSQVISPRTIEIDTSGVFYISTWNGEIVKSTDHGNTWKLCTKPYPDNPYYIYMYVANDNYIWVFKFDYPTLFSKDGGNTWTTAGSSLTASGFGNVFRMKNGTLLYHGSNCCSLNRSDDNGLTWTQIKTPGYSYNLFVSEKDEIFIISHPALVYRSKDMGATFEYLWPFAPEWISGLQKVFNKWHDYYLIAIQGYGISLSFDLEVFEPYWLNSNLQDLFIDHNGVLIVKDWDFKTVYYRHNVPSVIVKP
jgi:hypothetical protein